jgi:hypothetical protein
MAFLKFARWPALLALVATLPCMAMEYLNRRRFHEGYPIGLFLLLFVLAGAFFYMWRLGLQDPPRARKLKLLLPLMMLCAGLWLNIVLDQWPCWLGLPDCN